MGWGVGAGQLLSHVCILTMERVIGQVTVPKDQVRQFPA